MRPVTGVQAKRECPPPDPSTVYSVTLGLPDGSTQRPMMDPPPPGDGGIDTPRTRWHDALHKGKVTFLGTLAEQRRSVGVFGAEHQPAGIFVNAVDRAKDTRLPPALQQIQPSVGQRSAGMVEGGMHRNSCGLVQHRSKIIFVCDGKGNRFRLHIGGWVRWKVKRDPLPGPNPLIGVDGPALQEKAGSLVFHRLDTGGADAPGAKKDAKAHPVTVRRDRKCQPLHTGRPLPQTHTQCIIAQNFPGCKFYKNMV